MKVAQFTPDAAGRVFQVGRGEAAYLAFAPTPLPPELSLDPGLIRLLSDADRATGELAGVGRTLANPHLLIHPFIRREAVLSSRIEGTQTSLTELYAYEAGQLPLPSLRTTTPESDVREVRNYVVALEYGLERVTEIPVSLRLIRDAHGRLMEGVRGERAHPGSFRTTQNWIGRPGSAVNQATFVPPPTPEMHEALDAFEKYLHADDNYPPLVRLAFIHYQFEAIHPFVDGNGRIGRLLISLLLVSWNLLPVPLLYLSAFFERRRDDYLDLLQAVRERGAWREWVMFFLEGVVQQARDAVDMAKRLQDLQREWQRRLLEARSSALVLRLADSLFESPVLTIPHARRMLGVTYRSAQRNVEKLVRAGLLERLGEGSYAKTYLAPEILNVVSEGGA